LETRVEDTGAILRDGYWFPDLNSELQQTLLTAAEERWYPANDRIWRIGDPVRGLCAILKGDIRIFVKHPLVGHVQMSAIGPGCWCGIVPLSLNEPTENFELRCAAETRILFFPTAKLAEIELAQPGMARAFMRLLASHQDRAADKAIEARFEAPVRAARILYRFFKLHGVPAGRWGASSVAFTQQDLAELANISRQYANRLLANWEEKGIIDWRSPSQPKVDMRKLREASGYADQEARTRAWV
jgi:CRP-like cAMP-binding protein